MDVGTKITRRMLATRALYGLGKPLCFVKCCTPVLYMLDHKVVIGQGWYYKRSHRDVFLSTWTTYGHWGEAWN